MKCPVMGVEWLMQAQELRQAYQEFLDQSVRMFSGKQFEVAYHALAAAMHCAEALQDASLIADVQATAEKQGKWIDTNAPDHKLSSMHAKMRGNESIFVTLARHAHAILLGLKVNEQAKEVVGSGQR